MNNFETTNDFDTLKTISGVVIEFYELMEVAQGGPVVGRMLINGKRLDGRFGGPVVADGTHVYAPIQVRRWFGTSFSLAKINVESL